MNNEICFMQRMVDGRWEDAVNINERFGITYLSAKGLSAKGEIKNIYTEEWAEGDSLKVYIPQNPTRKPTDIVLLFGFDGYNRRDNYDEFCKFISGYKVRYWDNVRNREADMFINKKIEPEKDYFIGDNPYLVAPFKFTNIYGITKPHTKRISIFATGVWKYEGQWDNGDVWKDEPSI